MSEEPLPFPDCSDLSAIAIKMDFGNKMTKILRDKDIVTIADLRTKRVKLVKSVKKAKADEKRYRELIDLSHYVDHLVGIHGVGTKMQDVFHESEFDNFRKKQAIESEQNLDEICFGKQPRPADMDKDKIDKYIDKKIPEAADMVSTKCREQLKKCKFDTDDFLRLLMRSAVDGTKYVVVEGRTQLGKSNVKCLVHAHGIVSKTAIIVLTKGNTERNELMVKIKQESIYKTHFALASDKIGTVEDSLKCNGTIVGAQTAAQIRKLIKLIQRCQREDPNFRFAVVLDEADTMFRSRESEEARVRVEREWRNLLEIQPTYVVMISATIGPMLLHLVDKMDLQDKRTCSDKIEFRRLTKNDNYLGIDDFVPLKPHDGGPDVYLRETLTLGDRTSFSKSNAKPIAYMDENVKLLYDRALEDCPVDEPVKSDDANGSASPKRMKVRDPRRRGVLLLDITSPRVHAEGGVFEKAIKVQEAYYKTQNKKVVVIVFVGSGIHVRDEPSDRGFIRPAKELSISDVIQQIDDAPGLGLDRPVFIFGFSKMTRGISFRSAKRVPTHLVATRGRGYGIEDIIQTLGRGTFNGKDVLEENGFQGVTVLTTAEDLICARKYPMLTEFIHIRMQKGDTLFEALTGKNEKIPDYANVFRHTDRKVGPGAKARAPAVRIMKERQLLQQDIFEDPEQCDAHVIDRFHGPDKTSLKILEAIDFLCEEGAENSFSANEIQETYEQNTGNSLRLNDLTKTLRSFCDLGLLEKDTQGSDVYWNVKKVKVVAQIVDHKPTADVQPKMSPSPVASATTESLSDNDAGVISLDDFDDIKPATESGVLGGKKDDPICIDLESQDSNEVDPTSDEVVPDKEPSTYQYRDPNRLGL